jgi:hypothetical protein
MLLALFILVPRRATLMTKLDTMPVNPLLYTQTGGGSTGMFYSLALNAGNVSNYPIRSQLVREPAAEFLGVMILIIFGTGVDCQVVLSTNPGVAASPKGVSHFLRSGRIGDRFHVAFLCQDYLSISFGWAIGK